MTVMNPAGIPPEDRMTLDDACGVLGLSRKQLTALVEDGVMRGGQIGRRWIVYRGDVLDAKEEQEKIAAERQARLARREQSLAEAERQERERREERRRDMGGVTDAIQRAGFGYTPNGS